MSLQQQQPEKKRERSDVSDVDFVDATPEDRSQQDISISRRKLRRKYRKLIENANCICLMNNPLSSLILILFNL